MPANALVLTDKDRKKFAAYCAQESEFAQQRAENLSHLNAQFGSRERQLALAFAVVSHEINPNSWEEQTVEG